jgi:pSer/pThr/pTyr-binding forkhead associated (FHA) protein/Mg-chelatase subunit ChlD
MTLRLIVGMWMAGVICVFGQVTQNVPVDVMLVLDNSGSMKKNDPSSLMRVAVADFAASLKGDARLGIVVFDQDVRLALALTAINSDNFKQQVSAGLQRIIYSGRLTDIPAGIERAIYELRDRGLPSADRVVVLFTDGVIETGNPPRDLERGRWLREGLAAEARRLGIRIFGIAFTEAADFHLIQSIAQATSGGYYRVLTAPDISSTFGQIRRQLAERPIPPGQAQIEDNRSWLAAVAAGAGLLISVAIAAFAWSRRRRSKLPVGARLRDLGQHTDIDFHVLRKRVMRVGRSPTSNDIVIPSETVSSQHGAIEFRDGFFYVQDFRSANGTFINGKRFSDREGVREAVLKHGDRIRFDTFEFEFIEDAHAGEALTHIADGEQVLPSTTRLRQDEPAGVPEPQGMLKDQVNVPRPVEDPADRPTLLKSEMCTNHPSFKATEFCSVCKAARCHLCVRDNDGRIICADCAKAS